MALGCQGSPEASFNNLSQAFINWYFKYHPVESTRYGIDNNNGNFQAMNIGEREEYYADISRFMIELSQIDAIKMSPESRVDYNILYSQLEKMQFEMTEVRPWEWNPLWSIDEVSAGLYLLSEQPQLEMEERVEAIKSRLEKLHDVQQRLL